VRSGDPDTPATARTLRQGVQDFGRDVAIYWGQNLVVRVAQLALLPLYLAYLTPDDFGVLALATVYGSLVGVFLGLGLDVAVLRFYHDWPPGERRRHVGSLWAFGLLGGLALTVLFGILTRWLAPALIRQVPYEPYLRLALWTAFFTNFESVPLALLRIQQRSRRYALFTVGSFLIRESLKVYAAVILGRGALGVLQGGFYGAAIMAVIYTALILMEVELVWAPHHLRLPLTFALPKVPGGVLDTLTAITDRIVLQKFIPIGQLGSYEVGRRFGNFVRDASLPLKIAWVPYAIRLAVERSEAPRLLARMSSFYLGALLVFGVAAALLPRQLIALFGGREYAQASTFVPFFTALFVLDGAFVLFGTNLYIARKTLQASLAAAASFGVLLAASLALVPSLKIPGAFLALFIHRAFHGVLLFSISRASYPVPYEWGRIGVMTAAAVGVVAAGTVLPLGESWLALLLQVGLTLGFALLVGVVFLNGRAAAGTLLERYRTLLPWASKAGSLGHFKE
jgi:O-antigen/teichoic acid export membrane protein